MLVLLADVHFNISPDDNCPARYEQNIEFGVFPYFMAILKNKSGGCQATWARHPPGNIDDAEKRSKRITTAAPGVRCTYGMYSGELNKFCRSPKQQYPVPPA